MSAVVLPTGLRTAGCSVQNERGNWCQWDPRPGRYPNPVNGERSIDLILRKLGFRPYYECYVFDFAEGYPFRPDFWTPENDHFIEVTFIDKGIKDEERALRALADDDSQHGEELRKRHAAELASLRARWERKLRKVDQAAAEHGVWITLVTHADFEIERAGKPHHVGGVLLGQKAVRRLHAV